MHTILFAFALFMISPSQERDLLEVIISSDSILVCDGRLDVSITLQCKNNGKKNLLLYGMGNVRYNAETERLCNVERVGAGLGLLLYDQQHGNIYATETTPDSIDYKPFSRKVFMERMARDRSVFIERTTVVKAIDIQNVTMKIDFGRFKLPSGEYYLQVIYYAGKGLEDDFVVGKKQLERDRRRYDADVYQGCALSNTVQITIP